ncbi:hypothetical protein [Absidia glauca]|uniref:Uncharacterized protein n=1 Tax=Absidia glauca TaxID=4829 RepID=A0A163K8W7_ABSGL|nr:hypothetical protein [Absidia glauca]
MLSTFSGEESFLKKSPLPWVIRTGFTPQPRSAGLHWCPGCDMHVLEPYCEWCRTPSPPPPVPRFVRWAKLWRRLLPLPKRIATKGFDRGVK